MGREPLWRQPPSATCTASRFENVFPCHGSILMCYCSQFARRIVIVLISVVIKTTFTDDFANQDHGDRDGHPRPATYHILGHLPSFQCLYAAFMQ